MSFDDDSVLQVLDEETDEKLTKPSPSLSPFDDYFNQCVEQSDVELTGSVRELSHTHTLFVYSPRYYSPINRHSNWLIPNALRANEIVCICFQEI